MQALFSSLKLYALCFILFALPAWADSDHDRVREAVMANEIMPLELILQRVQKIAPGRILKVELEQERRMWVYEIKVLHDDGALSKLYLDAKDGSVVREKQKSYRRKQDSP